jgi:hypothetical protein
MTIQENVPFILVNGGSITTTHKGKKTSTKGTGCITCEVVFTTLDPNRIVDYRTTGLIICEINE